MRYANLLSFLVCIEKASVWYLQIYIFFIWFVLVELSGWMVLSRTAFVTFKSEEIAVKVLGLPDEDLTLKNR